ncbi:MAG: FdtA/QdtA family cupin domain-containing protein [Candidatus Pedobacter colombiensis]|uniref:FdtA/QdtA family cupin domain-containing protein n=1 Tax=Candidatus Pedobacter colombiensis TaxID=3121371 RepID=A0AAJ6B7L3_9SPHI|nr:FdtA/QdtA family cupin domain-containing protein [Pedobacter sp.]WEK21227.1 MAG: FdtA/QdtA family cupin domain-containing protein [Pedobacter sp.]
MANIINLTTFKDTRGILTVLDQVVDFEIKRLFYIYAVDDSDRGGHRHHNTHQAAICIKGCCKITSNDSKKVEIFELDSPEKCLILKPEDWHVMHDFSEDAILLVLASTAFDPKDYIYEPYDNSL